MEKVKELSEALRVEKMLVVQKDVEIQFIQYLKGSELLCRWTMKHHSLAMDFSNLDFETIDTEILADEAKEQKEATTTASGGEDVVIAKGAT
ncbi:hypothetical protein SO802_023605 [Lithocarpus litseifolius]|uniref:Uncharacterized protein n=1 Tax=Lithocarpus litseifolius TaxID=425828 RepID=A0AAW2C998_9ROSI